MPDDEENSGCMPDHEAEALRLEREAGGLLERYRLDTQPIYVVGSMDEGVTVLSQQVRALNLVWSLVHSGAVSTRGGGRKKQIAVVGGGFAGLTVAAGLLRKDVDADITVFERRDTALPLQQGSDTRWIHPHIYDWPMAGSESFSAALPLLNWTASRASDVVVQVLNQWREDVTSPRSSRDGDDRRHRFFCNTRHLQVVGLPTDDGKVGIEWVGEPREFGDPLVPVDKEKPGGCLERFDLVVLAVGFGLESDYSISYWRNEELAQPHLGQATMTYIVSGAGDGAMIDLFRIRIAQFRQDRILPELFHGAPNLLADLRAIQSRCTGDSAKRIFDELNALWERDPDKAASRVTHNLAKRLRRDTRVILHVNRARFADLFGHRRVSFQNKLLAFILYTAGGFNPSNEPLDTLIKEHGIPRAHVVKRHGIVRGGTLKTLLAQNLHSIVDDAVDDKYLLRQDDDPIWSGGFWDFPGRFETERGNENLKGRWRKEYLPGPTRAVAASFCAAVAGYLRQSHSDENRLRVTLHRMLRIGAETVLQQCCDYQGLFPRREPTSTAGRTFHANSGTIGAAYVEQELVRTARGATYEQIRTAMTALELNRSSRDMASTVRSIAALPLLTKTDAGTSSAESVVGVLYLDSEIPDYFSDDERMTTIITMASHFLDAVPQMSNGTNGTVTNNEFWVGHKTPIQPRRHVDLGELPALHVGGLKPAYAGAVPQLNLDYSDFAKAAPQ